MGSNRRPQGTEDRERVPPASVIIPAHNEEGLISRLLGSLTRDDSEAIAEIIVVCNGCTDRTADVARSFGRRVTVLELETPSKVNALNAGDARSTRFPRVYTDADVVLRGEDVEAICRALGQPGVLAAAPAPKMDFSRSSRAVRHYYATWLDLDYVRSGMVGAGVYALSAEGRRRFGKFPDVIADDGYVRRLFGRGERIIAPGAVSEVMAPGDLGALLKIKVRSRLGGMQLKSIFPPEPPSGPKTGGGPTRYLKAFWPFLKRPSRWGQMLIYLYVVARSWVSARALWQSGATKEWQRDETHRAQGDSGPAGSRGPRPE